MLPNISQAMGGNTYFDKQNLEKKGRFLNSYILIVLVLCFMDFFYVTSDLHCIKVMLSKFQLHLKNNLILKSHTIGHLKTFMHWDT